MMRYTVSIRKSAADWQTPSDEWSDEYYNEPFIAAGSPEEAEAIAKEFIQNCGYNPDDYDFLVTEHDR